MSLIYIYVVFKITTKNFKNKNYRDKYMKQELTCREKEIELAVT